jgi:hypothetical protein
VIRLNISPNYNYLVVKDIFFLYEIPRDLIVIYYNYEGLDLNISIVTSKSNERRSIPYVETDDEKRI